MARQDATSSDDDFGLICLADPACRPFAGSIVQDEFRMDVPWHHHDMHQLQYAFEGAMEVEDGYSRYFLPRSLAAWIPAGARHRNRLHRIRSVSVLLSKELIPEAGDQVRVVYAPPIMREMFAVAGRWSIAKPLDETGGVFFMAFAYLCREWITNCAPLSLPSTTDKCLERALAVAKMDPAGSQMNQAIKASGLSERTLRRRCQDELGIGWDEYRRRARLLATLEPLTETKLSIADIAASVGFESQSAYGRAFRQLTGKTPQAFRRGEREKT